VQPTVGNLACARPGEHPSRRGGALRAAKLVLGDDMVEPGEAAPIRALVIVARQLLGAVFCPQGLLVSIEVRGAGEASERHGVAIQGGFVALKLALPVPGLAGFDGTVAGGGELGREVAVTVASLGRDLAQVVELCELDLRGGGEGGGRRDHLLELVAHWRGNARYDEGGRGGGCDTREEGAKNEASER